jgi:hypothetical protein
MRLNLINSEVVSFDKYIESLGKKIKEIESYVDF